MPARTATRTCTAATRRPRRTSGDEEGAMKRTFLAFVVAAVAVPAAAQEDFQNVTVTFGALQKDFDTNSSKFLEYRDIPQGAVVPAFRFQGKKGDYHYDLQGRDVTQGDQRYRLDVGN